MKHLNFLSKQQSCGHSSVTLAMTVGSPSAHRRGTMLKLISVLVLIFTFGIGQMWGAEATPYSVTASNGALSGWSGSVGSKYADGSVKFEDSHYYSKTNIWSGDVSAKMTSISITINYKLNGNTDDGNSFTVAAVNSTGAVQASESFNPNSTSYADKEITLSIPANSNVTGLKLSYSKQQGNVGVKSLSATATYSTTCTVTYNANGATTGNVPTDNTEYNPNATVTVLGNTGNLERTGCTFAGWNTAADGSGTTYAANATFNISANTTLYAKWTATVTWKANNVTVKTDDIVVPAAGKTVTLPTDGEIGSNKCGDRIMGWTESESHKANTPPADLFTAAPTVQGSKTYYAVFADYAPIVP